MKDKSQSSQQEQETTGQSAGGTQAQKGTTAQPGRPGDDAQSDQAEAKRLAGKVLRRALLEVLKEAFDSKDKGDGGAAGGGGAAAGDTGAGDAGGAGQIGGYSEDFMFFTASPLGRDLERAADVAADRLGEGIDWAFELSKRLEAMATTARQAGDSGQILLKRWAHDEADENPLYHAMLAALVGGTSERHRALLKEKLGITLQEKAAEKLHKI